MTKEESILKLVRVALVAQLLLEETDNLSNDIVFKQDLKQGTKRFVKLIESKLSPMIENMYDADEQAITAFYSSLEHNINIVVENIMSEVKN
jgi:hypothetical protein